MKFSIEFEVVPEDGPVEPTEGIEDHVRAGLLASLSDLDWVKVGEEGDLWRVIGMREVGGNLTAEAHIALLGELPFSVVIDAIEKAGWPNIFTSPPLIEMEAQIGKVEIDPDDLLERLKAEVVTRAEVQGVSPAEAAEYLGRELVAQVEPFRETGEIVDPEKIDPWNLLLLSRGKAIELLDEIWGQVEKEAINGDLQAIHVRDLLQPFRA